MNYLEPIQPTLAATDLLQIQKLREPKDS